MTQSPCSFLRMRECHDLGTLGSSAQDVSKATQERTSYPGLTAIRPFALCVIPRTKGAESMSKLHTSA